MIIPLSLVIRSPLIGSLGIVANVLELGKGFIPHIPESAKGSDNSSNQPACERLKNK